MAWTKEVPTEPGWYWVAYQQIPDGSLALCASEYDEYEQWYPVHPEMIWDQPLPPPPDPKETP